MPVMSLSPKNSSPSEEERMKFSKLIRLVVFQPSNCSVLQTAPASIVCTSAESTARYLGIEKFTSGCSR